MVVPMPLEKFVLLFVALLVPFLFMWAVTWHAKRKLIETGINPPFDLKTTRHNRTFPKPLLKAAEKVARDENIPPDDPPLAIGDECMLLGDLVINGVGVMTVVDENDTHVVAAWDDGYQEHKFSREIVRRCPPDQPARKRKVPQPVMAS